MLVLCIPCILDSRLPPCLASDNFNPASHDHCHEFGVDNCTVDVYTGDRGHLHVIFSDVC